MSVTITTLTFAEARQLLFRADIITLDDIQVGFVDNPDELGLIWEEDGQEFRVWIPKDVTNETAAKCGNLLTFRDEDGEFVSVKLFKLTPITE